MADETDTRQMKILDHGYLEIVDVWGSDQSIIEAARMSTQKGFEGWGPIEQYVCTKCQKVVGLEETYAAESGPPIEPLGRNVTVVPYPRGHTKCWGEVNPIAAKPGDEKLLRYLWKHKHATPFEMAGMTIEVQAPIFVFREWHRHRTQSYNEMSARYAPLPDMNYRPTRGRLFLTQPGNKQAQSSGDAETLTDQRSIDWLNALTRHYEEQEKFYQFGLRIGVPKELARICLPVGRYSRMRASANLRNWLQFLTLRMDPAAQWEIRQYAAGVGVLIKDNFPRTWELFAEGLQHG